MSENFREHLNFPYHFMTINVFSTHWNYTSFLARPINDDTVYCDHLSSGHLPGHGRNKTSKRMIFGWNFSEDSGRGFSASTKWFLLVLFLVLRSLWESYGRQNSASESQPHFIASSPVLRPVCCIWRNFRAWCYETMQHLVCSPTWQDATSKTSRRGWSQLDEI